MLTACMYYMPPCPGWGRGDAAMVLKGGCKLAPGCSMMSISQQAAPDSFVCSTVCLFNVAANANLWQARDGSQKADPQARPRSRGSEGALQITPTCTCRRRTQS